MVKGIKRLVRLVLFAVVLYFLFQAVVFLFPVKYNETAEKYAKANNLEITNRVVDIKTILEDIREQIQNIE